MIKIKNQRNIGYLFHYAHFITDCLFVEVINEVYKYDEVIRVKNINQTLGNFYKIYEEVMQMKYIELDEEDFDKINKDVIIYDKREVYANEYYFDKFRTYIFSRYNINFLIYDSKYPEVLLIKRGHVTYLISDTILKQQTSNTGNGIFRGDINKIDIVEEHLKKKYKYKFNSIILENMPFVEQVKYFSNAKIIICFHGACMANLLFCKKNVTKIIEIARNQNKNKYTFVSSVIPKILNLQHNICYKNNPVDVINFVDKHTPNVALEAPAVLTPEISHH